MVRILCFFAVIGTIVAGCSGKKTGNAVMKPVEVAGTDDAVPVTVPLPAVPDSLRSVDDRAAFVALHFWDSFDFNSHQATDKDFVEQNFVNYISILLLAPADAAQEAVDTLLRRSSVNPPAFELFAGIARDYLDNPNSPMRDEETYILFLKNMSGAGYLDAAERIRYSERLKDALKNRIGTVAADFGVRLRGGGTSTLHRITSEAETTLLVFYDPDCTECHRILGELAMFTIPDDFQVVAVAVETDRARWEETSGDMPSGWTVAFPTVTVTDGLYVLPASPVFYLLGRDAVVMLKDPAPDRVFAIMEQALGQGSPTS